DNYEIVKELGRGGMGAVFLANDKRLKRQVAIKVLKIPAGMSDSGIEDTINNFKREAVAIANLAHNNIVCVYDIGNKDNLHYIVMELIDGFPLSRILKTQGQPFSLETTLKISEEICDALIYTHKNKVIHRDIKPENIIYTAKGVSKLSDFGIAKFIGDENLQVVEQPGSIKGTILYISPEQLQSPESVDGRSDMYSFAVSLYELLTGRLPFEGESPREVIMKILTEEPIHPSKINKDLIPHIDHVLLKALSKEPSKRYDNIAEFRDELRNISDFRARYSVQPMKQAEAKQEKYYYSQLAIESFEDITKYSRMLPEAGQQRLLYEIEMLFSSFILSNEFVFAFT
ncbi:MAG: serine/threonine protein kinase, partial [Flavobacterium sp.]